MRLLFLVLGITLASTAYGKPGPVNFPQGWVGNWQGQVWVRDIATGRQLYLLPMKLTVAPLRGDSVYSFVMQYDTSAPRNYQLVLQDRATNRWITDEQNSIFLKGYFFDGHYVDLFQVNQSLLRTDFELRNGQLIVRMETWREDRKELTGTEIPDITVYTYPPGTLQYGILQRQKTKKGRP
jgi:hypothetical protein